MAFSWILIPGLHKYIVLIVCHWTFVLTISEKKNHTVTPCDDKVDNSGAELENASGGV